MEAIERSTAVYTDHPVVAKTNTKGKAAGRLRKEERKSKMEGSMVGDGGQT